MATYLITGVAGFIGSTLARAVLAQGDRVVGFDNLSTGKRANLTDVEKRIELHEADLLNLDALRRACRGIDYVFHEAAIPSVPWSVEDPVGNNRANVDGTLNLLVAARDAKVKRVIYAASSSAYGEEPALPKQEDMLPSPISPYATAKLAGEYYMTTFYRCYGLETVSLRYFEHLPRAGLGTLASWPRSPPPRTPSTSWRPRWERGASGPAGGASSAPSRADGRALLRAAGSRARAVPRRLRGGAGRAAGRAAGRPRRRRRVARPPPGDRGAPRPGPRDGRDLRRRLPPLTSSGGGPGSNFGA